MGLINQQNGVGMRKINLQRRPFVILRCLQWAWIGRRSTHNIMQTVARTPSSDAATIVLLVVGRSANVKKKILCNVEYFHCKLKNLLIIIVLGMRIVDQQHHHEPFRYVCLSLSLVYSFYMSIVQLRMHMWNKKCRPM